MSELAANAAPNAGPRADTRKFYVYMAAACVAVAFIGFAPSYWVPMLAGTKQQPTLAHLHGMLFFGWTLFFLLQTSLVTSGKTAKHREWGLAGIALASPMLCFGILMTIHSLHANIALGAVQAAKAFSFVSSSGIVFFAILIAIAIANTHNRELHKRIMLVATISMLQPAIARWFQLFLAPPGAVGPPAVEFTVPPGLVSDLLIVVAMVYDKKTRGSIHRAYWIAGGALVALQVLRIPLSHTATWMAIADWMAAATL